MVIVMPHFVKQRNPGIALLRTPAFEIFVKILGVG
jgi:hypothetical protein